MSNSTVTLSAAWAVGKGGRPAHVFYVNNVPAGTAVANVFTFLAKNNMWVNKQALKTACQSVKWDDTSVDLVVAGPVA